MRANDDRLVQTAAHLAAALLIAALFSEALLVPSLLALLRTAGLGLSGYERAVASLLSLGIVAPTALLSACVMALMAGSRHTRTRTWLPVGILWLGWFAVLADAYLYRFFGRHLGDLFSYARLPDGAQAAGNVDFWVQGALSWAGWAALACVCQAFSCRLIARWLGAGIRAHLTLGSSAAIFGAAFAALWFAPQGLPERVRPRLMGALAFDPSPPVPRWVRHDNPKLAALQTALEREYASRYAYVFGPPGDPRKLVRPSDRNLPNISLVIAESFRADVFSPQRMPQLSAWSSEGMRMLHHYSGANHSETGLFSLLFGRSVLGYHSTLNAGARPALCESLRALGYQCGYFTGHPKVWVRREEFLNEQTMDVFSRDDHGSWNDWDEGALERAAEFLKGGSPRIAITFLMSSHYEYRYPREYRRHLPDTEPRFPWASLKATPAEFSASRNRYYNVVEYIDDLVSRHLSALERSTTLGIFTGDHGEVLGEDGRFGHGYGFAEPYVAVPFAWVGPGVPRATVEERTVHQDLLPSLFSLLGQKPTRGVGRSWFEQPPRSSLLIANTKHDFRTADAILLLGQERLTLRFDLEQPWLEVVEFEDATGRPIMPAHVDVKRWAAALAQELDRAGNPL